jgi:hypothetical protein
LSLAAAMESIVSSSATRFLHANWALNTSPEVFSLSTVESIATIYFIEPKAATYWILRMLNLSFPYSAVA